MSTNMQVVTHPMLNLFISSNVASFGSERRFNKDMTISALKEKLELLTGAHSSSMMLEIYEKEKLICVLDNDEAMLGSYQIDDGMRLHVIDKSGQLGQFEDVSKVEKFELTAQDYEQRTDTVRAFKERMKLGRYADVDPEEKKEIDEAKAAQDKADAEAAAKITIGSRCEIEIVGQTKRRAEVMFVGNTEFQPGKWVGVRYDEPLGKNDGSVKGKRYFQCLPKYGGFIRVKQVTLGDFPELGIESDEDEM